MVTRAQQTPSLFAAPAVGTTPLPAPPVADTLLPGIYALQHAGNHVCYLHQVTARAQASFAAAGFAVRRVR